MQRNGLTVKCTVTVIAISEGSLKFGDALGERVAVLGFVVGLAAGDFNLGFREQTKALRALRA
jgi:hypothetical protein